MSERIRVLVWYRCPQAKMDDFAKAFHAIGAQLAHVPGLLSSELLVARREQGSLVVMSEWESAEAFATWDASGGHKPTTAPIREYLDTARPYPFEMYQVLTSLTVPAFPDRGGTGHRGFRRTDGGLHGRRRRRPRRS